MNSNSNSNSNKESIWKHMFRFSIFVIISLIAIYFVSGFYYVRPKQIAVQKRFGKIINGNIKPGLHYAFPAPIDSVIKVEAKTVKSVIVDDFASSSWEYGSRAQEFIKQTNLKPYNITGDNYIVNTSLLVKYNIIKPAKFAIINKDPERLIKSIAAESLLILASKSSVDEILISGKRKLEIDVRKRLQKKLNKLQSGIGIVFIEIREISPPKLVQRYFDDVIKAKVERKKLLNEANKHKNKILPQARQYANKIVQEAKSYKKEQTLLAEGEAARFLSQLQSVSLNKNLLKKQQYLSLLKEISPKIKEIRVIQSTNSNH